MISLQKYCLSLGAFFVMCFFAIPTGLANDDLMEESLLGNTVIVDAGGMVYKTYYADDGTFESDLGAYGVATGTWEVVDGQLCTTSETGPQPGTQCRDTDTREIGEEWEVDSPMGPMTATLVEGKDF